MKWIYTLAAIAFAIKMVIIPNTASSVSSLEIVESWCATAVFLMRFRWLFFVIVSTIPSMKWLFLPLRLWDKFSFSHRKTRQ